MKKIYKKRIIDNSLNTLSKNNIGILITGVKGCGKTESAKQIAKSEIIIDDSSKLSELLNIDRTMLISGEKPRLIDE
jgi:SpoVK/Ycf46/Vps4 family AAA+-type ATPase